jgi:shikimate dehydrogenase
VTAPISATTVVAGVAGDPVRHSLSPMIHNAWIAESGLDAVYVAFEPRADGFARFALGLRGGVIRGLNVTAPFKEAALALADRASERSRRAGSANLLVFETDGTILADNTDGEGLLDAFRGQLGGFDPAAGPVVIVGAGGAARGAAAALLDAGAPEVRLVNRSRERAEALARRLGARTRPFAGEEVGNALAGAHAVINATPLGLGGGEGPDLPLEAAPPDCVVMDMVYRPLRTRLLERAAAAGLATVDGLGMLIGQAAPSFATLFGRPPPPLDIRSRVVAALERLA